MSNSLLCRPANRSDHTSLSAFLGGDIKLHRHMDWRTKLDWLGYQPFWLLKDKRQIQGVLSFPPDLAGVYWIRLFAASSYFPLAKAWEMLFSNAFQQYLFPKEAMIVALAYQSWMKNLLLSHGWQEYHQVVLMHWSGRLPEKVDLPCEALLRPMMHIDLEQVAFIDAQSFEPVWQHSSDAITRAFKQSVYATVVEIDDEVVGYQISTAEQFRAHLARLAVLPALRCQGIGYALVRDMLKHFKRPWTREISVNTQHNNQDSIRLYKKLGFELTEDSYPILNYPLAQP